jgi:hypothetical protein
VINEIKDSLEQNQARYDAVFFGAEQTGSLRFRRNSRHCRQIAGADVFIERVANQSFDLRADLNIHER